MIRKVIHMPAEVSPNVRKALREIGHGVRCWEDWQTRLKAGLPCGTPSGQVILPEVLTWAEYDERERTFKPDHKEVALRARFPQGAGVRLFPQEWLDFCGQLAVKLQESHRGSKITGEALGIDTAEGGNNTAFCVGNSLRALRMVGIKTADTNRVIDVTKDLQREYNVPPDKICFDIGGGGKEHCDRLRREMGWKCQAVTFSGKTPMDLRRGLTRIEERLAHREVKAVYMSRRVEMYCMASDRMNPATGGYGVPSERNGDGWARLAKYLKPLRREYDSEGVMKMPPKEDLVKEYYDGESPDEADAFVLMLWGLSHKSLRAKAGAA